LELIGEKIDKSVTVLKIHDDGVAEIVFVDYQERPTSQTKPLSDERLQEIYKKVYEEGHDNQVVALARAIEKAHGIK